MGYPSKHLVTEIPSHTNSAGIKQFLLPIETVWSEEFFVGITPSFRSHGSRCNYPNIQPNIVHYNQATGWGHSDWDYLPLGILKSGTDV